MNSYLKIAIIVPVLAILLWFVFNTFLTSTGSGLFGTKNSEYSGGDIFDPDNFSAEGFAAFENQKALEEMEKKVIEKRINESKGNKGKEENISVNNSATSENTLQSTSAVSTQEGPKLTPLQRLRQEQAAVAQQRLLLEQELEGKRTKQEQTISQTKQAEPTQGTSQVKKSLQTQPKTQVQQTQAGQQTAQVQHSQPTQQALQVLGTQNLLVEQTSLNNIKASPIESAVPKQPKTTGQSSSTNIRAIDAVLSVENSINCQDDYVAGVFFSKNSASMRGKSLLALDELIQAHKKCLNSVFLLKSAISEESAIMLDQRRRDEVKYYLLQRSVKKSAIHLDQ